MEYTDTSFPDIGTVDSTKGLLGIDQSNLPGQVKSQLRNVDELRKFTTVCAFDPVLPPVF